MLHRRLGHAEGEPAIDCRSHRHPIEITAVNPDDRYCPEVSTAMDGLTQNMRAKGVEELYAATKGRQLTGRRGAGLLGSEPLMLQR